MLSSALFIRQPYRDLLYNVEFTLGTNGQSLIINRHLYFSGVQCKANPKSNAGVFLVLSVKAAYYYSEGTTIRSEQENNIKNQPRSQQTSSQSKYKI